MTRFGLALVVTAALGAGCGGERRVSQDEQAVWTVEPAGEIGSIAGDDALADVLFVTVGPASRVYVTQWQVPHVAVFDSTGRPLGRIGRAGMGPGEFSPQPGRMGWKGDTLWVSSRGKTQLFSRSGEYLRGVGFRNPLPGQEALTYTPGRPASDGTFVTSTGYSQHLVEQGILTEGPILRVDATGAVVDTLAWIALAGRVMALHIREGTTSYTSSHPFRSEPIWRATSDGTGIFIVERQPSSGDGSNTFRILRISVSGDTLVDRHVPYQPVEVGPDARDHVVRDMARRYADRYSMTEAAAAAAVRESAEFPDHWPPVSDFVLSRDGHLWLRREATNPDSVRWQVLDGTARPVAEVWLPTDLEVHYLDERQVWGEVTDSLDVPYLRRYVVRRD